MTYFNNVTAAETADATLALLDIMPRECVEYLITWQGELFEGLTAQKVEEFITYDNMENYDKLDELAADYGYENAEEMAQEYYIITDVSFPGAILIL